MIDSKSIEVLAKLVTQFKALGDLTRLRVITLLAERERCVCELQAEINLAPNLLSHHLKVLREAGLITAKRRGRWIDYRLNHGVLEHLQDTLSFDPQMGIDASDDIRTRICETLERP